jgi:3-isopropylmalate/(R)-2-methylmalate dehydratase small subunit
MMGRSRGDFESRAKKGKWLSCGVPHELAILHRGIHFALRSGTPPRFPSCPARQGPKEDCVNLILEGNCWKFGHNIPTDMITPTNVVMRGMDEMVKHVLENANPDFPRNVQPGDIIVAGRNFGCSSGRAIAPKAIKATGVAAVLAEFFSRTFYRNGPEIGLPILEVSGIHDFVETGHRLRIDIERGLVENLTTGASIQGTPPSGLLLDMLRAGGLIPLLKSDAGRSLLEG